MMTKLEELKAAYVGGDTGGSGVFMSRTKAKTDNA